MTISELYTPIIHQGISVAIFVLEDVGSSTATTVEAFAADISLPVTATTRVSRLLTALAGFTLPYTAARLLFALTVLPFPLTLAVGTTGASPDAIKQ